MAHHKLKYNLADRLGTLDLTPGTVDQGLGVGAGTCQKWLSGEAIPSEAMRGRLANFLECPPSSLDRKMDEKMNGRLLAFARSIARAVSNGFVISPEMTDDVWKMAGAAAAFRGVAEDTFWDAQLENHQQPPRFHLE